MNISLATIIPGVAFAFVIATVDDTMSTNQFFSVGHCTWRLVCTFLPKLDEQYNHKHFSSTVKYIIYAAAMGVTYCFQGSCSIAFDLVTILCIAIIGYGVFLYSKSKRTIENIVGDTIKTFMLEARIDPKSDVDRENDDLDVVRMRMWKRAFICKRGRRRTWTAPDRMALSWSRIICSHHRI